MPRIPRLRMPLNAVVFAVGWIALATSTAGCQEATRFGGMAAAETPTSVTTRAATPTRAPTPTLTVTLHIAQAIKKTTSGGASGPSGQTNYLYVSILLNSCSYNGNG